MTYLRKLYVRAFLCSLVSLLVTLTYIRLFEQELLDWNDYGTYTIARPFIPDTLFYLELVNTPEWDLTTLAATNIKNGMAPALLWGVANGDWYRMALISVIIAFVGLVYVAKICQHFSVPRLRALRAITLIGLLPAVWYFSVGSLKELPTMTALAGFFYHHVKRQNLASLLWGVLLVSIRFQLAAVLPLFVFASFYAKQPLRTSAIVLIICSAAFPIFASLNILSLDVTAIFREQAGTESNLGAALENLRDTVPGVSAVVVGIRVVQSVLEPLAASFTEGFLFEAGIPSILGFASLSTLLLTLPAWYRILVNIVRGLRTTLPLDIQRLYALILFYAVPVGGFSFIHGRYMFPLTALVVVGAIFRVRGRVPKRVRSNRLQPPRLAHT